MDYLAEEKKLKKRGYKYIIGLDEAGRGPLAGPVVACAVSINPRFNWSRFDLNRLGLGKIKDSKKLSAERREYFYKILIHHPAIFWGTSKVSEKVIDRINVKNAAELAMEKALLKLKVKPSFLIIDGNSIKNNKLKATDYKLIVGADGKVFSCMAAGIIAKVTRDRIMQRYHKKYPQYGFLNNKGYPSKYHKKMIRKHGICLIHRRSFSPCIKIV